MSFHHGPIPTATATGQRSCTAIADAGWRLQVQYLLKEFDQIALKPRFEIVSQLQASTSSVTSPGIGNKSSEVKTLVQVVLDELALAQKVSGWLVGSSLDSDGISNDIDILFTPVNGAAPPTICEIERLFWMTIMLGLSALRAKIDVMLRFDAALARGGPLCGDSKLTTWLVEWPCFHERFVSGRLKTYRRVGRFTLITTVAAKDTNYFKKLPLDSSGVPFLRPGSPI